MNVTSFCHFNHKFLNLLQLEETLNPETQSALILLPAVKLQLSCIDVFCKEYVELSHVPQLATTVAVTVFCLWIVVI